MASTHLGGRGSGYSLVGTWPGWLGVLGGAWLMLAPYVLNYSGTDKTLWNDLILGAALIVMCAFCAIFAYQPGSFMLREAVGTLSALAGIWLIVAPFILSYTDITNALWNDIITGALFVIMSAYAVLYHTPTYTPREE